MILPEKLKAKYLERLDELIVEGMENLTLMRPYTEHLSGSTRYVFDVQRMSKWTLNCVTFLDSFECHGTKLKERLDWAFADAIENKADLRHCVGVLESLRENLEKGFLDDLNLKIEAEVAADYMGQAEALLGKGGSGQFDHVPAAVLAGAVLEKALRTLCGQHQPPIAIIDSKGYPKTLNPLIEDLKKAAVFNEPKAKQLRAWADIRNKAAHGEFDQFKKTDVEYMIQGINTFLADHLG